MYELPPVDTALTFDTLPAYTAGPDQAASLMDSAIPGNIATVEQGGSEVGPGDFPEPGPNMQATWDTGTPLTIQKDDDGPTPGYDWSVIGLDTTGQVYSSLTLLYHDLGWNPFSTKAKSPFLLLKEPGLTGQFGVKGQQKTLQVGLQVGLFATTMPFIFGSAVEFSVNAAIQAAQTQTGPDTSPWLFNPSVTGQAEVKLPDVKIFTLILKGPINIGWKASDGFTADWGAGIEAAIHVDFAPAPKKP